jgi:hypothetical protein
VKLAPGDDIVLTEEQLNFYTEQLKINSQPGRRGILSPGFRLKAGYRLNRPSK